MESRNIPKSRGVLVRVGRMADMSYGRKVAFSDLFQTCCMAEKTRGGGGTRALNHGNDREPRKLPWNPYEFEAGRSSQKHLQKQPEAGSQKQPEATRSSQKQPEATRIHQMGTFVGFII